MLLLTIYRTKQALEYTLYKLYQKKFSIKSIGILSHLSTGKFKWESATNSSAEKTTTVFTTTEDLTLTDESFFKLFIKHSHFNEYNFDIIISKITHGGDDYHGITLLSPATLNRLAPFKTLAPLEQDADLALVKNLMNFYPKAKHYAAFETSFHQTMQLEARMLTANWDHIKYNFKNYGSKGLVFEYLKHKLIDLTDKKHVKGKWIFIYLATNESTLCAIKNGKSIYCTTSPLHQDVPDCTHSGKLDPELINAFANLQSITFSEAYHILKQQDNENFSIASTHNIDNLSDLPSVAAKLALEYYIAAIAGQIMQLSGRLKGLDGIIFTGNLGTKSAKLRQLICDKLEWFGVEISNKSNLSNNCKLSKKSSKIQVFSLNAEPQAAMLLHLYERL